MIKNNTGAIGFIGQGWIGKNYADDFENRGFSVIRYSLEEPYVRNKAAVGKCKITFVAVPTPTTKKGFDDSALRSALLSIGSGNVVVIKSTTLPGTCETLQADFPNIIILHSPEFLAERTAAYDASHPNRNIIGLPAETTRHQEAAEEILSILPRAPFQMIMSSRDSELVKYAGNVFLYSKVLFMNTLYDVVKESGGDFESVRLALGNDPRIGESHTQPIHKSGHDETEASGKRGAGGHCFIKDFEAYRQYYKSTVGEDHALSMLTAMTNYNNDLLRETNKDLDLLEGVYGSGVLDRNHLAE